MAQAYRRKNLTHRVAQKKAKRKRSINDHRLDQLDPRLRLHLRILLKLLSPNRIQSKRLIWLNFLLIFFIYSYSEVKTIPKVQALAHAL